MRRSASGSRRSADELRPFDRKVGQAPVAPHETEDPVHRFGRAIAGEREPQEGQRIERMLVRHLERDAEPLRLPHREAIREGALARDLGRSLVIVRARAVPRTAPDDSGCASSGRAEAVARFADTRTARRNRSTSRRSPCEVLSKLDATSAARQRDGVHTARRSASSRTLHAAISSSVRRHPVAKARRVVHDAHAHARRRHALRLLLSSTQYSRAYVDDAAHRSPRSSARIFAATCATVSSGIVSPDTCGVTVIVGPLPERMRRAATAPRGKRRAWRRTACPRRAARAGPSSTSASPRPMFTTCAPSASRISARRSSTSCRGCVDGSTLTRKSRPVEKRAELVARRKQRTPSIGLRVRA